METTENTATNGNSQVLSSGNLEALANFVELQNKELEVRQIELELTAKDQEYSYNHSIQAMQTQAKDRSETRSFVSSILKSILIGFTIAILLMLCFIAYLATINKGEIALEIVKIGGSLIAGLLAGGGGGFALGQKMVNNKEDKE